MFRSEDFAELTTPAAPNRKRNIFFMARPPLLCEEGNVPRLHIGADLHRVSVRIQDVETEAASLLVDRSDSPSLEIRGHGFLLEVVDSDRDMVHFGWRITWAQDQKVFPKHQLVVSVPFVHSASEHALIEIGRSLQIADLQGHVIDTVALESRRLCRSGAGCQHRQSLNQRSP